MHNILLNWLLNEVTATINRTDFWIASYEPIVGELPGDITCEAFIDYELNAFIISESMVSNDLFQTMTSGNLLSVQQLISFSVKTV